MNIIHIQDRLRAGEDLAALEAQYSLEIRRHELFPQLVLFKYNQIASSLADPLVQQCRGLILDEKNSWNVVSRPFDKFFTDEDPLAAKLDWDSARVLEKVDGSLLQLFHWNNEWRVATMGSPDASGHIGHPGMHPSGLSEGTFASLFWDTFKAMDMELPNSHVTFLFELTSILNRVVSYYGASPKLTLIGVRATNGQEYWPQVIAPTLKNWVSVKEFKNTPSLEMLKETFETMDPIVQEGYVIVDKNFRRLKVKHPGYVRAHKLRSSFSTYNAIEVIRHDGEEAKILLNFPDMADSMNRISSKIEKFINSIDEDYTKIKDIKEQKEFAIQALKTPMHGAPLFSLRSGKTKSARQFVANVQINKLIEVIFPTNTA